VQALLIKGKWITSTSYLQTYTHTRADTIDNNNN